MLFVNVQKRKEFLTRSIRALEYQVKIDTTEKDRNIHLKTIQVYKSTLESLENNERKAMKNEDNLHEWKSIDCI